MSMHLVCSDWFKGDQDNGGADNAAMLGDMLSFRQFLHYGFNTTALQAAAALYAARRASATSTIS